MTPDHRSPGFALPQRPHMPPLPYPHARLTVDPYLQGVRIDSFLEKHFRNYSSWRLMRFVREGFVAIDGATATPERRVRRNSVVDVALAEPPDLLLTPEATPLDVVFEDDALLVVNKPAGMIVHPTGEISGGTLANAAQHHLDQGAPFPGWLRPGLVHRLDQDTSGAVAIAKHHLSHRELSLEFQRERVSKSYIALVHGRVGPDDGVIDLPIGRSPDSRAALMSCRADALEARPSRTKFDVLERFARYSLVRATPRTGRMHQIRIHLATLGHPLVGDRCYGPMGVIIDELPRDGPPVSPLIPRHALHAAELSFSHPETKVWMTFQAPLPIDFQRALADVRGEAE